MKVLSDIFKDCAAAGVTVVCSRMISSVTSKLMLGGVLVPPTADDDTDAIDVHAGQLSTDHLFINAYKATTALRNSDRKLISGAQRRNNMITRTSSVGALCLYCCSSASAAADCCGVICRWIISHSQYQHDLARRRRGSRHTPPRQTTTARVWSW